MTTDPALPPVTLRQHSWWRRALAALARPPLWASHGGCWAISAGIGATLLHAFSVLLWMTFRSASLDEIREVLSLEISEVVLVNVFFLLYGLVLAIPMAFSGWLFLRLFRRRTQLRGALWGAAFHMLAHLLFFYELGEHGWINLHVPALIGAMWGQWLPRLHEVALVGRPVPPPHASARSTGDH